MRHVLADFMTFYDLSGETHKAVPLGLDGSPQVADLHEGEPLLVVMPDELMAPGRATRRERPVGLYWFAVLTGPVVDFDSAGLRDLEEQAQTAAH